jgi:hypothetical protein
VSKYSALILDLCHIGVNCFIERLSAMGNTADRTVVPACVSLGIKKLPVAKHMTATNSSKP